MISESLKLSSKTMVFWQIIGKEELEKNINILQKIIETNSSENQEKMQAFTELEVKKTELEKIIEYKTKGAILRAKCRWHNEGEKIQNIS